MKQNNIIDVSPEDLSKVKAILKTFIPSLSVGVFGSRVTGKARKYSDLDLVVFTKKELDFDIYAALKNAFSESDLPFKVDLVDLASLDENFKTIIQNHCILIQN